MAKRYKKLMGMLVTAPHRGSVILKEKEARQLERMKLVTAAGLLTAMAAEMAQDLPTRRSRQLKRAVRAMMAETPKAVR